MPSKTSWIVLFGLNGLITLFNLLPISSPALFQSNGELSCHCEHAEIDLFLPYHLEEISGDDYPIEIPFAKPLDFVAMTLQETVEFSSNLSDPATEEQWATLLLQPVGMGRLHLGSKERVFTAIFWHQMHCIRELERGILDRSDKEATPHHIRHCLNYLRQHFLCEADYTLEEGDFTQRNFQYERSADTRVCRDWDSAYSIMGERIKEWAKNQKSNSYD